MGKSDVLDLEQALGQFILYAELLGETEPDRILYLAVEEAAYQTVFEEPLGELLLVKQRCGYLYSIQIPSRFGDG